MTYEAWRISYQSSEQAARVAYAECVRLQAKIEAMEQQEPYLYIYEYSNPIDGSPVWRDKPGYWNAQFPKSSKPLYLAPGAQPAPSALAEAIIADMQAQHDSELITENDSGEALIRLDGAIAAVEDNFALAQPAPSIPEGWKLVPIEPTPGMIDAAEYVDWGDADVRGSCINAWDRMLAAAPEAKP